MEIYGSLPLPAPTASPIDRIKYLISLMRKTQAQFGQLIGVDPSNMSKFLSGKIPVSDGLINKIVVNLGVSKAWLKDGTDIPFPRNSQMGTTIQTVAGISKGAPIYDIDVTAGCYPLSRMFTSDRVIGYIDLPSLNPDYPIVRVSGDSMYPKIPNGSFMAIRHINPDSPIFWGQIYVVVLEDYRMVKVLRRHPSNPKMIILHSENPNFDDLEIRRDQIQDLYFVEAILNYDIVG